MAIRAGHRKAEIIGAGLALVVFIAAIVGWKIYDSAGPAQPTGAGMANAVTISQRNRHFHPDEITIARGTVVHIVNDDNVTHHVYVKSSKMNFDSGEQPEGTTVDLEFDHIGTFNVLCAIHPTMHLTVTVR